LANVIPVFRFSPHFFKHGGVLEAAASLILPSSYLSKKKEIIQGQRNEVAQW